MGTVSARGRGVGRASRHRKSRHVMRWNAGFASSCSSVMRAGPKDDRGGRKTCCVWPRQPTIQFSQLASADQGARGGGVGRVGLSRR